MFIPYLCFFSRARNAAGETSCSSTLEVLAKSSIITDSIINAQGLESIQQLERQKRHEVVEYASYDSRPPRFVSRLRGSASRLPEGASAHFECQIEPVNDPDLVVEILHNGQPLKTGSRFRTLSDFGYVALDIAALVPEDSGVYSVRVGNRFGEISDSVELFVVGSGAIQSETGYGVETLQRLSALDRGRVYGRVEVSEQRTTQRPVFTRPLHNLVGLREGVDPIHLEARLIPIASDSMRVDWFKDGRPLPTGNRYHLMHDFGVVSLDIRKVEATDAGTYTLVASSDLGQATTTAVVDVKGKKKGCFVLLIKSYNYHQRPFFFCTSRRHYHHRHHKRRLADHHSVPGAHQESPSGSGGQ